MGSVISIMLAFLPGLTKGAMTVKYMYPYSIIPGVIIKFGVVSYCAMLIIFCININQILSSVIFMFVFLFFLIANFQYAILGPIDLPLNKRIVDGFFLRKEKIYEIWMIITIILLVIYIF